MRILIKIAFCSYRNFQFFLISLHNCSEFQRLHIFVTFISGIILYLSPLFDILENLAIRESIYTDSCIIDNLVI